MKKKGPKPKNEKMKKKKHKNVPSSLSACILAFCACAAAFAAASAPDPSLGAGGESSFFPATWKTSQTASMASCDGSSTAEPEDAFPPPPWTLPNSPSRSCTHTCTILSVTTPLR